MMKVKSDINRKIYYAGISAVIAAMWMGVLWENPHMHTNQAGFFFHAVLVAIISILLLAYPALPNRSMRIIIIAMASVYFYTLFFLYPDTWSTFLYIALIPLVSIFFFDSKLFYFSLALNTIALTVFFVFSIFIDQGHAFTFIQKDPVGNLINFFGSQILLYTLYYLTHERMKKQQLYYEQIQQSERIKTAGQLAAAVAHEIRNPLTVVKGFLQLYEQDSNIDHNTKERFSLMIGELDAAEEVIAQFLAVSAPAKAVTVEKVNAKADLHSVTSLLASYGFMHHNQIELHVEDECMIAANSMEFKQLFVNLIKNAIEASTENSSVRVSAVQKGPVVEIKVSDSGNGMTQEQILSLGTPFYSLKSKGTGLGLMICFNIVKKYNGSMKFQSEPGKGTTVTVQFPSYDK